MPVTDMATANNIVGILKNDPAIQYVAIVGIYHIVTEAESKAGGRWVDPNRPHQKDMGFEDLGYENPPFTRRIFILGGNEVIIKSWRKNWGVWEELDPATGYPHKKGFESR